MAGLISLRLRFGKSKQTRTQAVTGDVGAQMLTWVPPGHFYSPLVDPNDRHVRLLLDNHATLELDTCGELVLNDTAMLTKLGILGSYYRSIPFSADRSSGFRYYYENPAFSYGDAAVYFGFLLENQPRKIVEIGSGYSSCLAMDVNDLFLGKNAALTFIDPFPGTLLSLLNPTDRYRDNILAMSVQDVPTSFFRELQANDILFIDSSHVAKTGGDVNDYVFRILPSLAPGVLIHIHDIPYPFEYPPNWVDVQNRSWNEAYLIRAFLQYNPRFRVEYFNHYVFRKYPDKLGALMPKCLLNCGASLWIRKLGDPPAHPPTQF